MKTRVVSQYRGKSAFLGNIYEAVFSGENRFSYLYAIAILLFLLIAFTEMLNIIKEIGNHKRAELLKQQEALIQEELAKLRLEHSLPPPKLRKTTVSSLPLFLSFEPL
ncbi:MAG: hypothetical protein MZU97_24420 [Bacillus subtilis]|nr:hypothetical protein [Bacillus subtilis]